MRLIPFVHPFMHSWVVGLYFPKTSWLHSSTEWERGIKDLTIRTLLCRHAVPFASAAMRPPRRPLGLAARLVPPPRALVEMGRGRPRHPADLALIVRVMSTTESGGVIPTRRRLAPAGTSSTAARSNQDSEEFVCLQRPLLLKKDGNCVQYITVMKRKKCFYKAVL